MSGLATAVQSGIEIVDAVELAMRWKVPVSWIRVHTTSPRIPKEERIPHLRFGRYVRYAWGSEELNRWFLERFEQ